MNPNLDTDGMRLQALIEKRRRRLALTRWWKLMLFRLAVITAAIAGVL